MSDTHINNDEQLGVILTRFDQQDVRIGVIEQRLSASEKRNDLMETTIRQLSKTSDEFAQVIGLLMRAKAWLTKGRTKVYFALSGLASGMLFSLGTKIVGHFIK